MDNALRELAFQRSSISELRRAARAGGMRSLLEDARTKIRNGITTPAEAARVTQSGELMLD